MEIFLSRACTTGNSIVLSILGCLRVAFIAGFPLLGDMQVFGIIGAIRPWTDKHNFEKNYVVFLLDPTYL